MRKCVEVKANPNGMCVCARMVSKSDWEAMGSPSFKTMCLDEGLTRVGSMNLTGKTTRKFTVQGFQGGTTMARRKKTYGDYDLPIEDYELSSLDAIIASTGTFMPSKGEIKSILIAGGGAGAAYFGADIIKGLAVKFIPVDRKYIDWGFVAVKLAGAVVGGKLLYRYNPDLGSGVAVGLVLSALNDVAVMTGVKDKVLALLPATNGAVTTTAGLGRLLRDNGDDELILSQVDVEEGGRLSQVDVEEEGRLSSVFGYVPSVGGVNVAQ